MHIPWPLLTISLSHASPFYHPLPLYKTLLSPPIFCITLSSFKSRTFYPSMADRQAQVHPLRHYQEGGVKTVPQKGPSASKIVAVVTLLPLGGTLLALSGLTLAGTLFGLAITTPIFIIFSPVIVPAALAVGLSVLAFMASGAFGVTGLSSLSWVYNFVRRATRSMPEQIDQAKRRMQDMASYVGQKTKDLGQEIQTKAHDQAKRT